MQPDGNALRWSLAGTDPQGSLLDDAVDPTRELREVEYLHVRARTIISEVPRASRMPFRFTINPYRGCSHACTYCFARPTHEYLGLDGGDDFERRIVVKINAVERLAAELARPSWRGEHIAMGTNTATASRVASSSSSGPRAIRSPSSRSRRWCSATPTCCWPRPSARACA
jgi:hypothetical protein